MSEAFASGVVSVLGLYVGTGLLVAVYLHARGLVRMDPQVVGAGWAFRLLATPGLVAFWPLLLARTIRGAKEPPAEHNAHRDAAGTST